MGQRYVAYARGVNVCHIPQQGLIVSFIDFGHIGMKKKSEKTLWMTALSRYLPYYQLQMKEVCKNVWVRLYNNW